VLLLQADRQTDGQQRSAAAGQTEAELLPVAEEKLSAHTTATRLVCGLLCSRFLPVRCLALPRRSCAWLLCVGALASRQRDGPKKNGEGKPVQHAQEGRKFSETSAIKQEPFCIT